MDQLIATDFRSYSEYQNLTHIDEGIRAIWQVSRYRLLKVIVGVLSLG